MNQARGGMAVSTKSAQCMHVYIKDKSAVLCMRVVRAQLGHTAHVQVVVTESGMGMHIAAHMHGTHTSSNVCVCMFIPRLHTRRYVCHLYLFNTACEIGMSYKYDYLS